MTCRLYQPRATATVMRGALFPAPSHTYRKKKMGVHKNRGNTNPGYYPWMLEEEDAAEAAMPNIVFEPFYRVMLHYSQWKDTKTIARLVRLSVPVLSNADCIRVVEMAERYKSAIVVTAIKDEAELYMERLLISGLQASMETA